MNIKNPDMISIGKAACMLYGKKKEGQIWRDIALGRLHLYTWPGRRASMYQPRCRVSAREVEDHIADRAARVARMENCPATSIYSTPCKMVAIRLDPMTITGRGRGIIGGGGGVHPQKEGTAE